MAKTEPAYSERDLYTIRSATHIVLKAWRGGEWHEQKIVPGAQQSIPQFLAETQEVIRSKPEYSKALIYLANAEDNRVSMPKGFVPSQVLADAPQAIS